jgi:uncharacterized protein (TIGR00269 family)
MAANGAVCNVCSRREAFFFRSYSGTKLCRKCFAQSIEDKTRATIAKYNMLDFNDRVAVAVSGGKDSVSLLHVLAKLEKSFPKASLAAVTIDEGIKGYRDEALKIAAENCEKLGVEHSIVSFKELYGYPFDEIVEGLRQNGEEKLTSCACCGVLRRKALNLAARKVGANKIATGHTLDDETQTILLNIFHGDVLRLAKEKPVTDEAHPKLVQKIKPFCEIPEKETAMYAYVKKIKFQSTPCPYASEALRNDVRAMLDKIEEKHAGTKFTIFKSVERIRPTLETLDQREGMNECTECGEPTSEKICRTCQLLKQMKRSA